LRKLKKEEKNKNFGTIMKSSIYITK